MLLFIVGSLLTLFAAIFNVSKDSTSIIYVVLIFSGVFSGILNITYDEEHHFLVAAVGLLVFILVFNSLLTFPPFLSFLPFLRLLAIFIGSMLSAVALKVVVEFGAQSDFDINEKSDFRTKRIEHMVLPGKEKVWSFTVFIAICATFIIVLLELFFSLSTNFTSLIVILDFLITFIFIIDLFVLYKKESGFKSFLKNCWPDIIAAVPFSSTLQMTKLIRLIRLSRVSHTAKFFSEKSSASHYIDEANFKDKDLYDERSGPIKLHASKKKTKIKK